MFFSACENFDVFRVFFAQRRGGISYQPTDKKALYVRMLGEESCSMHEYLLASIFAFTLGILGVELHVKNVITFDEQKKEWTEQDAGDKQVERFKES